MFNEKLSLVTVSDMYADYLDVMLGHNRALVDHCCVVTTEDDKQSQRIAGKYDCILVKTDDSRKADGTFNKGMMIERGLLQLPSEGWHVHVDSDVVMPSNTRQRLAAALYSKDAIYGADRMNVVEWAEWAKLLATGWAARGFEHHHFLTHPINKAEVGGRLIYGEQGWVPVGYFQLWHASAEYTGIYRTRGYSNTSNSAAHDDVQFALKWDRHNRILIPELLVAHLMTDDVKYGTNWYGRRSKPFGPPGTTTESYLGSPESDLRGAFGGKNAGLTANEGGYKS